MGVISRGQIDKFMNKLFQTSVSPSGKLACILEGDKGSVWMYLKDLSEDEIILRFPGAQKKPMWRLRWVEKQCHESQQDSHSPGMDLVNRSGSHQGAIR